MNKGEKKSKAQQVITPTTSFTNESQASASVGITVASCGFAYSPKSCPSLKTTSQTPPLSWLAPKVTTLPGISAQRMHAVNINQDLLKQIPDNFSFPLSNFSLSLPSAAHIPTLPLSTISPCLRDVGQINHRCLCHLLLLQQLPRSLDHLAFGFGLLSFSLAIYSACLSLLGYVPIG